jgi:pimeloyl-ACP methyl ester carboxylesterase
MNLHFEEYGQRGNPSLVILHGFFASSRNWRLIAKKLAQKHHVFVPDLRNHGLSPHAVEMDYPNMATDVKMFLAEREIVKPFLMGHSMGGKVAMWLALNDPDLIQKLIVVDIAPVTYRHSFENVIQALLDLPLAEISNRKQAEDLLAESLPDLSFRQFILQNLILKDGEYCWRTDLAIFQKAAPAIIAFPNSEDLPPYSGQSLFVVGEKSTHVKEQYYDKIETLFPGASIETLKNAGHWLHAEQPEQFLALVNQFTVSNSRVAGIKT